MAIRAGDRVLQPTYGVGDVIEVTGDHVTIAFDSGGVRKFVASIVHLTPSDAPRPERPQSKAGVRRASSTKRTGPGTASVTP